MNQVEPSKRCVKFFQALIITYLPIGALIGLVTPDNILDYQWARIFTDIVAFMIPLVSHLGPRASVPATQFVCAAMNVVAMVEVAYLFIYYPLKFRLENRISKTEANLKKKALENPIILTLFCVVFAYGVLGDPLDFFSERRGRGWASSTLVMGLFGGIYTAGGWMSLAGVILCFTELVIILRRNISKTNK